MLLEAQRLMPKLQINRIYNVDDEIMQLYYTMNRRSVKPYIMQHSHYQKKKSAMFVNITKHIASLAAKRLGEGA